MEIHMSEIPRKTEPELVDFDSVEKFDSSDFGYVDRFSGCLLPKNEVTSDGEKNRYGPAPIDDRVTENGSQHHQSLAGSLESTLAIPENEFEYEEFGRSRAGCHGYISYFSKLSLSDINEKIDVDFVDSLIRGGADVNANDIHGQSIMFEIVRQWTTEAAEFALSRGVDICAPDYFGRTPLHLAAALDNAEMVTWLLDNGCDIHSRTKGELQTPIHYASKSNAVHTLKILIARGANIQDRDFKQRTSLFLAAEQGRSRAVHFLLTSEAPVGVYDDCGTSAISVMAAKMPDIANIALQQFITNEKSSRRTLYHLNYLETVTWRDLAVKKGLPMRNAVVLTLLEVLCKFNELGLIMHPVINRLIHMKWKQFGRWKTIEQVIINLFYTLLWTALAVTVPTDSNPKYYTPVKDNIWRLILEFIGCSMTLFFVIMQILNFKKVKLRNVRYSGSRIAEIERDLQYCHPRWPEEERYISSETEVIRASAGSYLRDMWNVFEWTTFLGIVLLIATRTASILSDSNLANDIHFRAFPIVLILIWLRLMKYFRSFQTLGPFITMLGHVIDATLKFCFLFFEIFIPYICAFWILFGGVEDYKSISDVIYQVFLMTLVGDYSFEPLEAHDKFMAQIMVGTYIALAAVVCLNLYIALMSETFTRVFSNARANAYMLQARQLLEIEENLSYAKKSKNHKDMLRHYAPEVVYSLDSVDLSESSQLNEMRLQVNILINQLDTLNDLGNENTKNIKRLGDQCSTLSKSIDQGSAFQKKTLIKMKRTLKRMHDNNPQQLIKRGLGLESDGDSSDGDEGGIVKRLRQSSVANLKNLKDRITTRLVRPKSENDMTKLLEEPPSQSDV